MNTHIGRIVIVLAVSTALTGCASSGTSSPSTPEAATIEEVEAVCERYAETRDLPIGEMWAELEAVAPPEIRGALIRLQSPPAGSYWEDRGRVEEFLDEHCPDVP